MGRLRVATLLIVVGAVVAVTGVWQQFGRAWGLIAAGVLGIGYGLLLVDVDGEG